MHASFDRRQAVEWSEAITAALVRHNGTMVDTGTGSESSDGLTINRSSIDDADAALVIVSRDEASHPPFGRTVRHLLMQKTESRRNDVTVDDVVFLSMI